MKWFAGLGRQTFSSLWDLLNGGGGYFRFDLSASRNGNMLSMGDAEVTLYTGMKAAGTWKIKDCPRSVYNGGTWWHVFTLDAQTNRNAFYKSHTWSSFCAQNIGESDRHAEISPHLIIFGLCKGSGGSCKGPQQKMQGT